MDLQNTAERTESQQARPTYDAVGKVHWKMPTPTDNFRNMADVEFEVEVNMSLGESSE
jgi:hypothetical protein